LKKYFSLIKFSHTVFALPFAIIGYHLGIVDGANFSIKGIIAVVLCMVFARSAAMAFNRYLDRNIDAQNPRTRMREIPSGAISEYNAILFVIVNSILFIITTYFINTICFYLSLIALLVILGYSYTKRFTYLCHIVLGIGLSLAPLGAYLAVKGQFEILPLLFSGIVMFWVAGFDIIYALQDEDFDKNSGLNSIPAKFGIKKALFIAQLFHVFSAIFLLSTLLFYSNSIVYSIGAMLFLLFLLYQHSVVKINDLSKINLAFFTANGIASILYATFFLIDFYFLK
jgi:4-hydroxybenzoate polyprenyltransferase